MIIIVLIVASIFFQTAIDAKEGFFMQGYGSVIYYTAGITFVLMWIAISKIPEKSSDKDIYIIHDGVINEEICRKYIQALRVLKAYINVARKMNLIPLAYNLKIHVNKLQNAYATGLSKGKTMCVFTETINNSTDSELESVVAHEFGHIVNNDVAFLVLSSSLGCCIGCIGSLLGLVVVWQVWGLTSALVLFAITGLVLPLFTNYGSRSREYFADAFAAMHGYGPGLASFLQKIDKNPGWIDLYQSHPLSKKRRKLIDQVTRGDEGAVSDQAERNLKQKFIFTASIVVAAYLYLQTAALTTSIYLILSTMFYLCADSLLNGTAGTWHAAMNYAKTSGEKPTAGDCLSASFKLLTFVGFYLAGLVVCYHFMGITTASMILPKAAEVMFYLWLAKPIIAALGDNEFFGIMSDLITFAAIIVSVLMLASFFFVI